MRRLLATGLLAPVVAGVGGGVGVWAARENLDAAPAIVAGAIALAAVAVGLRQRGVALAALGVAAAAAFVSPAGLGPFLVVTGAIVASTPASIDRRLGRWPEVVDGLVCVPALAGLASVVAAQPSERGLAVGGGTAVLAVLTWWRGPRHGVAEPEHETAVAYLGAIGAAMVVGAPELFDVLGVLPDAIQTTGQGLVSAFAVFAIALLAPRLWAVRTNRTPTSSSPGAHRRRADSTKPA